MACVHSPAGDFDGFWHPGSFLAQFSRSLIRSALMFRVSPVLPIDSRQVPYVKSFNRLHRRGELSLEDIGEHRLEFSKE